ncbi:hypothetical protein BDZ89DRAFT_1073413, partial [Hymenopellis radicata]
SGKSQGLDFAQRIRPVVLVITSIWLGVMWRSILGWPGYIQILKHEVFFKCIRRNDLSATLETMAVISKVISSCVWS